MYFNFFKDFTYLFLDRGEGKEKERERNINVWLPLVGPPLGTWPITQAGNPEWESNRQTCWQTGTQLTELHQPGLDSMYFKSTHFGSTYHMPGNVQRILYTVFSFNLHTSPVWNLNIEDGETEDESGYVT